MNGKENWLHLGMAHKLNEKYSKSYDRAFFYISTDGKKIKVELWSNWNSSYNHTDILKAFATPFNAIREYTDTI